MSVAVYYRLNIKQAYNQLSVKNRSTVLLMLNQQSARGNGEQGKKAILRNNVRKSAKFPIHSKLFEIYYGDFSIIGTEEPKKLPSD
ncbi:hypothetical protein BV372_10380 [Nostoc sp. T09]|nr:hypothetical protein BV372_10380 [Nostoc sp. T09]